MVSPLRAIIFDQLEAHTLLGIAPYSGLVPVTSNSRVLEPDVTNKDPAYPTVQERCARIGALCQAFGPMRIDARRRQGDEGDFVIFDVNSKPVSTLTSHCSCIADRTECDWPGTSGKRRADCIDGDGCRAAWMGLPNLC
jgi:hypothetical protein